MTQLREYVAKLNHSFVFYGIFIFGAIFASATAGIPVWQMTSHAFATFASESIQVEADASNRYVELYIRNRTNRLREFAKSRSVAASALGNRSAVVRAEEMLKTSKISSDQDKLTLYSLTQDIIIDQTFANPNSLPDNAQSIHLLVSKLLTKTDHGPLFDTIVSRNQTWLLIAVPVIVGSDIEGVLLGQFHFNDAGIPRDFQTSLDFFLLTSSGEKIPQSLVGLIPTDGWHKRSSPIENTDLTHHYFRNVTTLNDTITLAFYHTIGALVLGLIVAFAVLIAMGQQLMLNPFRELEASRKSLNEKNDALHHGAYHDSLTGLANRRSMDEHIGTLSTKIAEGQVCTVYHIDLDYLKQINDSRGHAAGDFVLQHVSRILEEKYAPDDFIARVGGDEFVAITINGYSKQEISALADSIVSALRTPVMYEGKLCHLGASVGVSFSEASEMVGENMIVEADLALIRAKKSGRNRTAFYDETDKKSAWTSKALADDIRGGIEKGEFVAVYQPQVCARSKEVHGIEALARWNHPTKGVLPPAEFLDVAEEYGLLAEIDECILKQAIKDVGQLDDKLFKKKKVSVNVSTRRLYDDDLIEKVKALEFEPDTLAFELLETIFLDNVDPVLVSRIDQLRELGVRIEIDDFGTGHASIMGLLNLSPDGLKIDRKLIQPIVTDRTCREMIAFIVGIARSLDISVIAEGVETDEHVEFAGTLGCQIVQGYAIAEPLQASELKAWLEEKTKDADKSAA